MLVFLKYLILLIISPAKGWEDIASSGLSPRKAFERGLLPAILLCGLTCVIPALYSRGPDLWQRFVEMAVTVGSYFVTYFLAMFALTSFSHGWINSGRLNGRRASLFTSYNLAVLVLFNILRNLIPDENALIDFLPVFDILIMWKGASYLDVKESCTGQMMLMLIATILVPPTAIGILFDAII